jgi:hypothetical protein
MDHKLAEMKAFIERNREVVTYDVQDMQKAFKARLERKMWTFCDHVVKEFRFLHQNLENKIYLELGYLDKMPKVNDHFMKQA